MTANPNDTTSFDDCGFDVFQGDQPLDFVQLSKTRKVAMFKITEGMTESDSKFVDFTNKSVANGLKRLAAYHFAHGSNVQLQMDHFIGTFKTKRAFITNCPSFLFMLDLERGANPPGELDGITMVRYLKSLGIVPIIYCGFDFWLQNWVELHDCICFVAEYGNHPISPLPWRIPSASVYGFDFWQYTGDRLGPYAKNIAGGSDGMDLSCFNVKKNTQGVEAFWDAALAKTKQPV